MESWFVASILLTFDEGGGGGGEIRRRVGNWLSSPLPSFWISSFPSGLTTATLCVRIRCCERASKESPSLGGLQGTYHGYLYGSWRGCFVRGQLMCCKGGSWVSFSAARLVLGPGLLPWAGWPHTQLPVVASRTPCFHHCTARPPPPRRKQHLHCRAGIAALVSMYLYILRTEYAPVFIRPINCPSCPSRPMPCFRFRDFLLLCQLLVGRGCSGQLPDGCSVMHLLHYTGQR